LIRCQSQATNLDSLMRGDHLHTGPSPQQLYSVLLKLCLFTLG